MCLEKVLSRRTSAFDIELVFGGLLGTEVPRQWE